MGSKILIQKIYSKGSGELNEDEWLIKNNIFAVFDGLTGLTEFIDRGGKTGGKLAAEIAKEAFSENGRPLKELAILANNRILDKMEKAGVDTEQKEALWSTTAAVVRLLLEEVEFFQIGDSLILAIYQDDSYKLLTEYLDHDLETMILWKELAEQKEKNIRTKLQDQIVIVRRETNITHGALNGEKEAIKFFKFGKIGFNNIKSLILFTDGLIIPKEDPKNPDDWLLFVKIYQKSGLPGLLKYIRSLEKEDPYCWRYSRFKQYDDVAAIGIDFL